MAKFDLSGPAAGAALQIAYQMVLRYEDSGKTRPPIVATARIAREILNQLNRRPSSREDRKLNVTVLSDIEYFRKLGLTPAEHLTAQQPDVSPKRKR
jgi:hypothetical protein